MSENKGYNQRGLDRLTDALLEDILNESDEEILADYEDDPAGTEERIAKMRALIDNGVTKANKQRLADAKAAVVANRTSPKKVKPSIDVKEARRLFNSLPENQKYTLAARNESELSDTDIINIVENLKELGVLPSGNEND